MRGAAAAVAVHAGLQLLKPAWGRVGSDVRGRFAAYSPVGGAAAATLGPWLVAVLLACGAVEVGWRRVRAGGRLPRPDDRYCHGRHACVAQLGRVQGGRALARACGFPIILLQADAVERYGWMTDTEFLNAVALGRSRPGRSCTVAAAGYAAAGVPGLRLPRSSPSHRRSRSFSAAQGASTASSQTRTCAASSTAGRPPSAPFSARDAAGAAGGRAWAALAGAAVLLFVARRGVVLTLLVAGAAGVAAVLPAHHS